MLAHRPRLRPKRAGESSFIRERRYLGLAGISARGRSMMRARLHRAERQSALVRGDRPSTVASLSNTSSSEVVDSHAFTS
jgi:hypothetical protein